MKTDEKEERIDFNLFDHYRKLLYYLCNRFKGNNYSLMREYLTKILVMEVEEFMPLWNKRVLDVGGAKGEFCKTLYDLRKCDAINVDLCPGDCIWPKTIIASADNLPFHNNVFDLVICRGVLEHIPTEKQQQTVDELYRVTKTGGICYIMIPPWYNPHAGHHLKPFHILPFKVAKFLRELIFGNKIDANSYEEAGLYPITFRKMVRMISKSGFKILTTKDTHLRLHFLTKIPGIREVAVPAVSFILTKE